MIHHSILRAIVYRNYHFYVVQNYLNDPKANDIAKEMVTEFLKDTLGGKSLAQYNEEQIAQWEKTVSEQQRFLIKTKGNQ